MVYFGSLDCRIAARKHFGYHSCQGLFVSGVDFGQSGIAEVAFDRRTVEEWGNCHPFNSDG